MSARDTIAVLIEQAKANVDAAAASLAEAMHVAERAEHTAREAQRLLNAHDERVAQKRAAHLSERALKAQDMAIMDQWLRAAVQERDQLTSRRDQALLARDRANDHTQARREHLQQARAQMRAYEKHRDERAKEQLRFIERKREADGE